MHARRDHDNQHDHPTSAKLELELVELFLAADLNLKFRFTLIVFNGIVGDWLEHDDLGPDSVRSGS